jgi:hypothetical protein
MMNINENRVSDGSLDKLSLAVSVPDKLLVWTLST